MTQSPKVISRAAVIGASAAAAAAAALARVLPALAALERSTIRLGLSTSDATFLPIYIGLARTYKAEGLDVSLFGFRGDAESMQALAGDSIDISGCSLTALIAMISAGQPVMGFYSGFYQAPFAWLAVQDVKSWADLKGKTMGVSTFGSGTDALTRYVLRKHGLVPEKDVQMMQSGGSANALPSLRAGRLGAAILTAPFKWQAQDDGMTVLGTQVHDVAPQWPINMLVAKKRFLDENPNAMLAFLRAHVSAIRIARADKAFAVRVLTDQIKLAPAYVGRAYDEDMPGFGERGTLPDRGMPEFWTISEANGDVKAPWPSAQFLDDRYIRTFARWAPKA